MKNYLEIFSDSYQRVSASSVAEQDFFEAFYRAFIGTSTEVADKFKNVDMEKQRQHLRQSLDQMIYFSIDRKASDTLFGTAKTHSKSGKNIRSQLYETWLESLLETVRKFDTAFNEETEIAWRVVLAPGISYMKTQYHRL
jgi:hypothetical protein